MGIPASPFVGRLLSEIARHEGGMAAACAEMGVSPQDIDALANGRAPSPVVLEAIYDWLGGQSALSRDELEDYERLRASAPQAEVAIPSGSPAGQQASPRLTPSRRAPIVAATVIAIMIIVVITAVLTVVIIRPGNANKTTEPTASPTAPPPSESPSAATASPSPTAASGKPTAPATASRSPVSSSSASSGELIGSYKNFHLSCGYTIEFGSGGAPQPVSDEGNAGYELGNDCYEAHGFGYPNKFDTGAGELALLTGAPTYTNCAADTDLGGSLNSLVPGNIIC